MLDFLSGALSPAPVAISRQRVGVRDLPARFGCRAVILQCAMVNLSGSLSHCSTNPIVDPSGSLSHCMGEGGGEGHSRGAMLPRRESSFSHWLAKLALLRLSLTREVRLALSCEGPPEQRERRRA
jgi:hypothetical protein